MTLGITEEGGPLLIPRISVNSECEVSCYIYLTPLLYFTTYYIYIIYHMYVPHYLSGSIN